MKQEFLKAKADTIRMTVYENNRPVVPSAATITLYKAGSTTELQAAASASVNATTGELTYSLTSTHTANIGINFKAEWKYTVGGTDFYEQQLFDVVLSKLSIPITDDDLFNELDSLRDTNLIEEGTATAGAAGTLTDTNNRKEADDFWTGGSVEIIAGTGDGQIRDITDFVQATSVISVSPNWATNPSTDSVYKVVRGFSKKIQQSFDKLSAMLYNKGQRHALIIESSQVKTPMIYLTVHFICLDLMKEVDDKWSQLANRYWDLFTSEFGQMKLDYDADESGTITGDEEQSDRTALRILRS